MSANDTLYGQVEMTGCLGGGNDTLYGKLEPTS